MGTWFYPQPVSRPVVYQNITMTSPILTLCSAPFKPGTQQIRVISSIAGFASVDQSTSSTQVTSVTIITTSGAGMSIPAAGYPEYFAVTPGQVLTFCTTGLTTGYISVTEMA